MDQKWADQFKAWQDSDYVVTDINSKKKSLDYIWFNYQEWARKNAQPTMPQDDLVDLLKANYEYFYAGNLLDPILYIKNLGLKRSSVYEAQRKKGRLCL